METKTLIAGIAIALTLIGGTFTASKTFATKDDIRLLAFTVQQVSENVSNTQKAMAARTKVSNLENEKYDLKALHKKYPNDDEIKEQAKENKDALGIAKQALSAAEGKL